MKIILPVIEPVDIFSLGNFYASVADIHVALNIFKDFFYLGQNIFPGKLSDISRGIGRTDGHGSGLGLASNKKKSVITGFHEEVKVCCSVINSRFGKYVYKHLLFLKR